MTRPTPARRPDRNGKPMTVTPQAPAFNVLLRSEQSDGHLAVIENIIPARWEGTPLHHHEFDEAWYVVEGTLTFQLGDDVFSAGPGSLTFAARGSHHAVANHSATATKYVLICTPATFERYFDELAAKVSGINPPEDAGTSYPETHVVGPLIARDSANGT
jgi:mannose-6-phosphate isomerase-like protein (cupin superfamily)